MRKLIFKIVLVMLPFVIIAGTLEIGLAHVQDEYSIKAKLFLQQKKEIEILFLGASPTAYGIDPSYMDQKAFNFGNFYQLLNQDTALVRHFAPEMPKLKLVIFNIIPPVLELSNEDGKSKRIVYKYHQLYGTDLNNWKDWFDLRAYSKTALFGYRNSINYLFRGFHVSLTNELSFSALGFVDNKSDSIVTNNGDQSALKEQLSRLITPFQGPMYAGQNRLKLEHAIKLLHARKVEVAFIISPVTLQFSENYSAAYQRTMVYLKELQSKYAVQYYDYFLDSRFNGEEFRDYLHLNSQGASKFSQIVNKEVLSKYAR